MDTHQKEPIKKQRVKTDKSLEDERHKTDDVIEREVDTVEADADKKTRLNRIAADKKLGRERQEADLRQADEFDLNQDSNSETDDKALVSERERSDEAQGIARRDEDRIRNRERNKKRLVAEALLENERKDTDSNLLDERSRTDLASEKTSALLSKEKYSHDLTKTALITRDQFLAVVSHDLRNPLTSISMGASLMRRELSKGTDHAEIFRYLEIIERSAANIDRMISDLLDVERMSNDKLMLNVETNDVCALLNECVDIFAPVVLSKSFSMTLKDCAESIFAEIDHDRVLQVLSNLIGNALKFAPKGSIIDLSAKTKNNEVEISVSDHGPGIPENKKAEIFERFSQLKTNDRRGLGLGLFISKWIVEAHHGRIWATSESGKGSTFSFTLPLKVSH